MLPGFNAELMPKGQEKESQAKIKRYMTMMDSMTNEGMLSLLTRGHKMRRSGWPVPQARLGPFSKTMYR